MAKSVVSGVLLLDKPSGISSHTALSQAKRLFMSDIWDSKKAGHTGTLDPMATGLLPICLGEATKFSGFGLDADKGYTATVQLGTQTDTADADGQVIQTHPIPPFDQAMLDTIAAGLMGSQMQIPPMYSALKKDGKKLYEYARDGIELERTARPITIHHLSLTKISEDTLNLVVTCSKGTYVRVLAESVANQLGTLGHLSTLRRTLTGGFDVADAVSLTDLSARPFNERFGRLLPIDAMLLHLPTLALSSDECARIRYGQRLNVAGRLAMGTGTPFGVRLYQDSTFVGLGELAPTGRLQPVRLING